MPRYCLLLIVHLFLLCGCGTSSSAIAERPTATTRVLRIYNWDTYINPDILDRFSAETGVAIIYKTYSSNEEMLAEVEANPQAYDIVVPSDYMVAMMRNDGYLAALNRANIPNLINIDPLFSNPSFDPANRYCVPYLWGTLGVGYNIKATGREITSWNDIFDPAFAGRVALLDDPRSTLGFVLLNLGYSPNTTNPDEIMAAYTFLENRGDQITAYAPDDGQDMLAAGSVDIAYESSGDIFQVMSSDPNLRYSIPKEGSLIWIDNICILKQSANKAIAEQFINFILDAEIGAELANYTRYSSPNIAALERISSADRQNTALYPDAETRNRLFFLVDVGEEANALYNDTWEDLTNER